MAEIEQETMDSTQPRHFVRECFCFTLKFQRLSEEVYEDKRAEWAEKRSFDQKILKFEEVDADKGYGIPPFDPRLLDFLLQMDDKLDHLISLYTGQKKQDETMEEGEGIDLSGGGMKIRAANSLSVGQILQADLLLSRLPFVRIHVFGEVVNVTATVRKEKPYWEAGVRFLDLNSEDQERIIGCVFQRQREALRKRKGKESTDERLIENGE